MKADLVIRSARIIGPDGELQGGVAVKDGIIVAVAQDAALPEAHRTIDAEGRVLMPGVIDPHCHLGYCGTYEDDLRTETAEAAKGGVTTTMDYIQLLEPDWLAFYREHRALVEAHARIDFGFHYIIQREDHIGQIPEMVRQTGIRSFKFYFGYEPQNPIGIVPATDGWIYAAMRILAKIPGGVINVHCENTAIGTWLKREMQAQGRQDLAAFTESRPAFCEVETIRRMIFLAEKTGCPLHLVHTSVGQGPVLAAEAQARGIDITVETCPHYLTRTAYDADLDMKAKIMPPLRDRQEQDGLWRGVFDGSVFNIGTDHVPFPPKKGLDLWTEAPGVIGFGQELPLMLHFGVHQRGLALTDLARINAANPARKFGLWPRKGAIAPGFDADLNLIDLDLERTVEHKAKGTCLFEGWRLKGWPVLTIVRGEIVCQEGEVDDTRRGRCVTLPAAA